MVCGTVFRACAYILAWFLVLAIAGWLFGIREGVACVLGALGLLLIAVWSLLRFCRIAVRWHRLSELAIMVERARPELMDSLICALELEGTARERELRVIEQELVSDVRERIEREPRLLDGVFRPYLRRRRLVGALLGAALCVVVTLHLPSWDKFRYGLTELLNGSETGILITAEDEVALRADYRLKAVVTRWEQEAVIVWESEGTPRQYYPMNRSREGNFSFTFYDVGAPFKYRVRTPSLQSGWRTVSVYVPPALESIRMELTPLAYTGRKPVVSDTLQDMEMVAGESLKIILKSGAGNTASLVYDGGKLPFVVDGERLVVDFVPEKGGAYEIRIQDGHGHLSTFAFAIELTPDMPPVISCREPAPDSQVKPGDSLRIIADAADDYGLCDVTLQFSVNGGPRQRVSLRQASKPPWESTWEVVHLWDLPALGAKTGDMLSCVLLVQDNRQPTRQTSRSDLFFIIVRPDPDSIEADANAASSDKKANVADLIAECKRLLRLTWDTMSMPSGDARKRATTELNTGLNELDLEIRKRLVALEKMAGGNVGELLTSLFMAAADSAAAASRLTERGLYEESIPLQERSLSSLAAIETELIKNTIRSKKAQGKEGEGKQGDNDNPKKPEKKQDSSAKPNKGEDVRCIREALEQLRKIAPKQDALNASIARQDTLPDPLAALQERLRTDTDSAGRSIRDIQEAASGVNALDAAISDMKNAARSIRADERQRAGIHGKRASIQLQNAIRALEDALRKAAAGEIAQLSERANQLSEQQKQEASKSGQEAANDSKGDAAEARARQEALNKATDELLQYARQAAGEMEEEFPDVSKEVNSALRDAEKRGLRKAQTRAKNALLYKRFNKAEKEQIDAANYLKSLSNALRSAADKMPAMGEQELREALMQLQQDAAELNSAMKDGDAQRAAERIERARQSASQTVSSIGNAMKNKQLQQLGNALGTPQDVAPGEAAGLAIQQIMHAASTIGGILDAISNANRKQLLRRNAPPPEKYRRQVEEYFRKIGSE